MPLTSSAGEGVVDGRRKYIKAATQVRLHHGAPTVTNGMSLCGLRHTAFDRHVLGIRPDYHIELRQDILEEEDGPMLRHGLQGFQGKAILLPRRKVERPKGEFLEERYEQFRKAG